MVAMTTITTTPSPTLRRVRSRECVAQDRQSRPATGRGGRRSNGCKRSGSRTTPTLLLVWLASSPALFKTSRVFDMLQAWPTWLIVVGLFLSMLAADEVGFRLGRRQHRGETDHSRTVSNLFKGSVFGLVALLLGFSFSA